MGVLDRFSAHSNHGLSEMKLVASDAYLGLKSAIRKVLAKRLTLQRR